MTNLFTPVSRRNFLQLGIGVSALFLIIPQKFSIFLSKHFTGNTRTETDSKYAVIAQRYGSEFGDIKAQGRRP